MAINNARLNKILKNVGYIICGLQFLAGIMAGIYMVKLDVIPNKYIVLLAIVHVVLVAAFVVLQRWQLGGLIAKFVSLIISGALVWASAYMGYTYNQLKAMAGIDTKIDNIHVYVMKEDPAQNMEDAQDYTFGILRVQDRKNTDTIISETEEDLGHSLKIEEYNNVSELIQSLYDQKVQAVILNSAYISFVTDDERYADFVDKVRSIAMKDIESQLEDSEIKGEYLYSGEHVFTVYVSGVDTREEINVNSNSDVNILITANLDTHQILMISTPRDYYVPLSISDGVEDKLTHAGGYGIDVSKDTLGMLYEVNIDDYVRINFTGFTKIIDELGGITVYSEHDFWVDDYHFTKGYNNLDGEEALAFTRCRKAFTDGDLQRGKHQMLVIEAAINKMVSSDMLKNYTEVLDAISDCMITSMTHDEISDLVKLQLDEMESWDIVKYSVTGFDSMSTTTYSAYGQELYVMIPDEASVEKAKTYLEQIYAGEKIRATE